MILSIQKRKKLHFLKGFEITCKSIFLSARSNNIKMLKRNKEKYGKLENIFLRLWVWISVGSSHIFLKVLNLPINLYFCPPVRIILSRFNKIKKNMDKLKIFFYRIGFGYPSDVIIFS